jgi:hypothetical protein
MPQGRFNPSGFADDVMVQEVRGLGRGRGFMVVGRKSILSDNETIRRLKDRLLVLVRLLHQRGLLDAADLMEVLDLSPDAEAVGDKSSEDENQAFREESEETDEKIRRMVYDIEEELYDVQGVQFAEDEDVVERLRNSVTVMLDELRAAKENAIRQT